MQCYSLNRNKYSFPVDSFMVMVNDVSFIRVCRLVKAYRTARSIDVNKYISPASLSAGCEHSFAGRDKQ